MLKWIHDIHIFAHFWYELKISVWVILKWRSKIKFALLRKDCVLICWSICYADIDECANETLCGSHGFCDNTVGSFHCLCDRGYTNSPSSHDCIGKSHSAFIDPHSLLIQNSGTFPTCLSRLWSWGKPLKDNIGFLSVCG